MAARRNPRQGQAQSRPMNADARSQANEETGVALVEERKRYNAMIEKWQHNLSAVLPAHMSVERFTRIVGTAVTKNPDLLRCSRQSMLSAMLDCATLGLEPGTLNQHAWLIPYEDRERGLEVQLQLGYRGLVELAMRGNSELYHVDTEVVYEADYWRHIRGLRPSLEHTPEDVEDRGQLTYAYAIARMRGIPNEQHPFVVVGRQDILRACSPKQRQKEASGEKSIADRSPAWRYHEPEMWKKTAVRKLVKLIRQNDAALGKAISIDESAEMGVERRLSWDEVESIDVEPSRSEQERPQTAPQS